MSFPVMTLEEAAETLCSEDFDAYHRTCHPRLVEGCPVCKIDTIQLDASLHFTRATKFVPPRKPDNAWERGVTGEHRADGSFMPFVDSSLAPISTKQYANRRGHLDAARKANRKR